jgi:hypothetical protein
MAKTTVEIISDNAVIVNAISESTLNELLAAVHKLEKSQSNSNNDAKDAAIDFAAEFNPVVAAAKGLSDAVQKLGQFIGGAAKATSDMAKLMADGETKLSAYGTAVNDNLIKNIPFVGKLLGSFGDILLAGIQILEGWNDTLKKTSAVGASFGNSLVNLRMSAANAGMDIDQFANVIISNVKDLAVLGGNATAGAELFSKGMDMLYSSADGVGSQLLQLGMSSDAVGSMFAKWLTTTQYGKGRDIKFNNEMAESFKIYATNYDRILKLTGMDQQTLDNEEAIAMQDIAYQRKLATLDPQEQRKLKMRLDMQTAIFGKDGAELEKARVLNQYPISQGANNIYLFARDYQAINEKDLKRALDHNVKENEYAAGQRKFYIDTQSSLNKTVRGNRDWYTIIGSTADGQEILGHGMKQGIMSMLRFGKINEQSEDMYGDAYDTAAKEQKKYESLTKLLDTFESGIRVLRKTFLGIVIPEMKTLSEYLQDEDFRADMKNFGTYLSKLALDGMKWTKGFFENLNDPYGQQRIKAMMTSAFELVSIQVQSFAGGTLRGWISKSWQKAYEAGKAEEAAAARNRLKKNAALAGKGPEEAKAAAGSAYVNSPTPTTPGNLASELKIAAPVVEQADKAGFRFYDPFRTPYKPAGDFNYIGQNWDPRLNKLIDRYQYKQLATDNEEPVYASTTGTVITAGKSNISGDEFNSSGLAVEIFSPDPTDPSKGITTRFSNLSQKSLAIFKDLVGKEVKAGDLVGYSQGRGFWGGANPLIVRLFSGKGYTRGESVEINPNTYQPLTGEIKKENQPQLRTGTLGVYGKMFGEFGSGTPVTLHGTEAVITPSQMSDLVKTKDQIMVTELISSLNTNVSFLISMAREEISTVKNKIDAQGRAKLPQRA